MVKIVLEIFLGSGITVIYFLALIVATMISVAIFRKEDADDLDYAMTANVIQFFVVVMMMIERIVPWMK